MMPTSAPASTTRPTRTKRPVTSVRPMTVSVTAVSTSAAEPETMPRVSRSMVATDRSSAGLSPGTNFNAPKTRKTSPRLTRSTSMLCVFSHVAARASTTCGSTNGTDGGRVTGGWRVVCDMACAPLRSVGRVPGSARKGVWRARPEAALDLGLRAQPGTVPGAPGPAGTAPADVARRPVVSRR